VLIQFNFLSCKVSCFSLCDKAASLSLAEPNKLVQYIKYCNVLLIFAYKELCRCKTQYIKQSNYHVPQM
jgi:hypothetical protein